MKVQSIIVSSEDDGIRFDKWFKRHYKHVPFTLVARLIRKGQIKLNGKKKDISAKIVEGDEISFAEFKVVEQQEKQLPKKPDSKSDAKFTQQILDNVIYMDDKILVINKPAGVAVQGGSKIKQSIDGIADELKFDGFEKPKLVHRLDKETSGILVMARRTSIAAKLSEVFRIKQVEKIYLALTSGLPSPKNGKIDIAIDKERGGKFEKVKADAQGKKAVTFYELLDHAADKFSLIKLKILTGRTHQIRVHLSHIGCPIIGDDKYGERKSQDKFIKDQLYLHAQSLSFVLDGNKYSFEAELPEYFTTALNDLGLSDK